MSNIKGTIESVSCKEGNDHPKYGMSYQTSIKIAGEWYGAFTKKTAEQLGLDKGKLVSFTWTQNGKYKNFDPKSLAVADAEEDAPTSAPTATAKPAAKTTWAGEVGTKVGHAINNAVQLGVATGKTDLKSLHGYAVDILTLGRKLEGQYDAISKRADKLIAEATAKRQAEAEGEPESAPAPAPKKATKPAAKPVVKKAVKPPVEEVPPESDPDDPGATEDDAPGVATEPKWDDDIPF